MKCEVVSNIAYRSAVNRAERLEAGMINCFTNHKQNKIPDYACDQGTNDETDVHNSEAYQQLVECFSKLLLTQHPNADEVAYN